MALPRCPLRFHRIDGWVGLDPLLAHDSGCDPDCDHLAREISEGPAVVFNSALWVAFLGGLCRTPMASTPARQFLLINLDVEEALIEQSFPENIARWQHDRRDKMVFKR